MSFRIAPNASKKKILRCVMVGLCVSFYLSACGSDINQPNQSVILWDTAFNVNGVPFPSEPIIKRSVVDPGNNNRMSKFFEKCKLRKEVKIGFIGGSITEGALASPSGKRYSTRLCEFLGKAFPGVKVKEINAGIGATDSRFGCSRIQDDLLIQEPDLIVLEFAVNDLGNESAEETIEGLVRQSLDTKDIPVVIFQTMNKAGDSIPHVIQRKVGKYYNIPIVGYHSGVFPLVASGEIPWESISPDYVHPNNEGHLICAYLLYSFLKSEFQLLDKGVDNQIAMPKPLVTELYQSAGFFRSRDSMMAVVRNDGWSFTEDVNNRYSFISQNLGDRLNIKSSTREVTVSYHFSKELDARVQVLVDGLVVDTLSNHFPQDWGGGYLKPYQVYKQEGTSEHQLEFINISGGRFDLRYVLYAK